MFRLSLILALFIVLFLFTSTNYHVVYGENHLSNELMTDRASYTVDQRIIVTGQVHNGTQATSTSVNIVLQASSDGAVFHQLSLATDTQGHYVNAFLPLKPGNIVITVWVVGQDPKEGSILTVPVSQDSIPQNAGAPASITLVTEQKSDFLSNIITLSGDVVGGKVDQRAIILDAKNGDRLIYNSTVVTGANGKFSKSFSTQEQGSITLEAKFVDPVIGVQTATDTITILGNWWLIILAMTLIAIAFLIMLLASYERLNSFFIIAVASTIAAYIILYVFRPLGSATDTIALAFAAPVVTFVIQFIQKRRDSEAANEDDVKKYKVSKLKEEVDNLIKFADEVERHQGVFMGKGNFFPGEKLVTGVYYGLADKDGERKTDPTPTIGAMANFPSLRLNRYYHYTDRYNNLLRRRAAILQKQKSNEPMLNQESTFIEKFEQVKKAYSLLNTTVYLTLSLSIFMLQREILSLPGLKFPVRVAESLDKYAREALKLDHGTDICTALDDEDNVAALVQKLGQRFISQYDNLEKKMQTLDDTPNDTKGVEITLVTVGDIVRQYPDDTKVVMVNLNMTMERVIQILENVPTVIVTNDRRDLLGILYLGDLTEYYRKQELRKDVTRTLGNLIIAGQIVDHITKVMWQMTGVTNYAVLSESEYLKSATQQLVNISNKKEQKGVILNKYGTPIAAVNLELLRFQS